MSQEQLTKISNTLNRVATGVADLQEDMKETAKGADLEGWKDEILASNDKVVKEIKTVREEQAAIHANYEKLDGKVEKLDSKVGQVLTEQKAITINYKRVDQRLEALEEFATKASQKFGIEFQQT